MLMKQHFYLVIIYSRIKTGLNIMKRKAFVTGSTGFLGLNLLEELNKRNWDIVAMQYEHAEIIDLSNFGAVTVKGDINDYDSLVKLIPEEIDAIFHVAGNTSMWSKNNEQQKLSCGVFRNQTSKLWNH